MCAWHASDLPPSARRSALGLQDLRIGCTGAGRKRPDLLSSGPRTGYPLLSREGLQLGMTIPKKRQSPASLLDPNAPAFEAGSGFFRSARVRGPVGLDGPEGRRAIAQVGTGIAVPAPAPAKPAVAAKPPPVTEPVEYPPFVDEDTDEQGVRRKVRINVEVLRDGFMDGGGSHAKTTSSGLPEALINFEWSGGKTKQISSYSLEWTGTLIIQTNYPEGLKRSDRSAYGRGTGPDVPNGNVSLGFHESCHRRDYLAYLERSLTAAAGGTPEAYVLPDSQPPVTINWKYLKFPAFNGKVGQTIAEFQHATNIFKHAIKSWNDDMGRFSDRCTDQFGAAKSKHRSRRR